MLSRSRAGRLSAELALRFAIPQAADAPPSFLFGYNVVGCTANDK